MICLSVAQERWRPLLQLHGPSHPLLREARSAHPSRIQYPSLKQKRQRSPDFFNFHGLVNTSQQCSVDFFNAFSSEIFNAEVLFREDSTPDEFIDVIVGNRVYMPCLYVCQCSPSYCALTVWKSKFKDLDEKYTHSWSENRKITILWSYEVLANLSKFVCLHLFGVFFCPHFIFGIYRCTIRWIKSPSRRWTAWLADLTVLSSGQISVCVCVIFLFLCMYVRGSSTASSVLFCFFAYFSCGMKLNLDYLLETLWEYLALICIYTKKRGGTHAFLYSVIRLSRAQEYIFWIKFVIISSFSIRAPRL